MKRVLVTGGSRGVGLAICRRLLVENYRVIAVSRTGSPELDRLRRQHRRRLEHYAVDLSAAGAVVELSRAARLLEGIDGFVANAGIGTDGLLTLSTEESLRACFETNLVSTILLAREVIKGMLSRGGSLVFISSVAARTGLSGLSVYSATKGALLSFSRTLAREYGERGIRSNCVLPGFIETEMNRSLGRDLVGRLVKRTALKRLGQPEDVAGAVAFLLSADARYVTGTEVVVDGGLTV